MIAWNELVRIGNSDISVKECKGQRVVTFNSLNYRLIYVAMADDGLVKVGVTKDYFKREKDLSNTEHGEIVKHFETERCLNSFEVEKAIHERLNKYCYFGEWYKADFDYVVEAVRETFSNMSIFPKDIKTKRTSAKYRCNTLLDYFNRSEVPING